MLIDDARPAAGAGMVAELTEALRLPVGFGEDPAAAARLARFLDVAVRVVEERAGRALLQRTMTLRKAGWDAPGVLRLPVAPVRAVETLELVAVDGASAPVDPGLWRLDLLGSEPAIRARAGRALPTPPRDGHVEARLLVGHAERWEDAPFDLRHAAVRLAASYHDGLSEGAPLPIGVIALLEPYRKVRL